MSILPCVWKIASVYDLYPYFVELGNPVIYGRIKAVIHQGVKATYLIKKKQMATSNVTYSITRLRKRIKWPG